MAYKLSMVMRFPHTRLRRMRQDAWSRRLVAEARLSVDDLIWPLFVTDGESGDIAALPGVRRHTPAETAMQARRAWTLGIPAVALFPVIDAAKKCPQGREALRPDNLVCRAVRAVKDAVPELGVIGDVALDPYTSHGQDGVLGEDGRIANDDTLALLCEQAVLLAGAGCDMVAPSDMMDGRIGAIRATLEAASHHETLILSYAAKYASCFYGPFREALGSAAALGTADKRSYQMDPANGGEALREVEMDLSEGADAVLIKPGMPYLDVIRRVYERFQVPVFAYQVGGEYAMLKHAAAAGAFGEEAGFMESLLAFKRAGASGIVTYAAPQVAGWLG